MKQQRPINLDLTTLKFPPMALVSIAHRISGVVLFILLPFVLYVFSLSLSSQESFLSLTALLQCWVWKGGVWVFMVALVLHVLAGVRHLAMDMGLGEGLIAGRVSAWIVLVLAALMAVILGVWLW